LHQTAFTYFNQGLHLSNSQLVGTHQLMLGTGNSFRALNNFRLFPKQLEIS